MGDGQGRTPRAGSRAALSRRDWLGAAAVATVGLGGSVGCKRQRGDGEVVVFAAASLSRALAEITPRFQQSAGVGMVVSSAASGDLARQLIAAPKAHLFISASEVWMDTLQNAGRLVVKSRVPLLSNRLVVVVHREHPTSKLDSLDELSDRSLYPELVLGDPKYVPAGVYAEKWLEQRGVLSRVKSRIVPMPHVSAVAAHVSKRRRAVGIVYLSDVIGQELKVIHEAPAGEGPKITYPMALISGRDGPAARRAYDFLREADQTAVFERHGFARA